MRRLRGTLIVIAALRGQRRLPFRPRARIEAIRDARIRRLVAYAARTIPHYRELLAHGGIDPGSIRGARDLARLPLLNPEEVRADPERFLSTSRRARGALGCLTSGSGGDPMEVHHDRRSLLENIAYGERERAPVIEICGSFRPRELRLDFETSNARRVLDFYAANTRLPVRPRRSSVHMTDPFEDIVAAINASEPELLTGYGGYLDLLFRTVAARGTRIHAPKVIMQVGEPLPAERRRWIERELGARVMSRYCAAEAFKIGYFCERRTGFHLHDDLCHVRVLDANGRDAAPGEEGEIVISNLLNHGTVLLNYRIGDLAALSPEGCGCGRNHRLMSEVRGRVEEVLRLPGGERLDPPRLRAALGDDPSILQHQLLERGPGRFELRLMTVDERSFGPARDRAIEGLRAALGDGIEIEARHDPELGRAERRRTGKFRVLEVRRPGAREGAAP